MIETRDSRGKWQPVRLRGDIAIVGMACTYPGARNLPAFWQNILDKVNAIREVPRLRWDPALYYDPDPKSGKVYCKFGGYLGETFSFNPMKHGTMPRAIEGAEPDQFLVLRAVYEAMSDAGYLDKKLDGKRCEIILGRGNYLGAGLSNLVQRGMITEQTLQIIRALRPDMSAVELRHVIEELHTHLAGFGPDTAPGIIPNVTTGRVTNRLDFMGPNYTVDAACASSLISCELAIHHLLLGSCDFALVGGIHIFTNVPFLQVFCALGALSPSGSCRPFAANADGVLSGEGVGILVIKRLEDAERDRDRIYAVIKGVGTASDGRALGVTAPRLEGEVLAVQRAYEMASVDTKTIGLLEGHGTGTVAGDDTELHTLRTVFGPRDREYPQVALGSVKSMIGHAMPAAGAASLIKTVLALYHRVLPPTLNCEEPHEMLRAPDSRFYANTEARPWVHGDTKTPRRAGVDAFGFGGINAHLILEEYTRDDPRRRPSFYREWPQELCVLEGATRGELADACERVRDYCRAVRGVALRDVAYTLATELTGKPHRLGVIATSTDDLAERLDRTAPRIRDEQVAMIKDARGIFYVSEPLTRGGKVAFLFPGEGSQYLNMMGDLCMHFPEVQDAFDAADRAAQSPDRYPPSIDIFPPPAHSEEELKAAEARLMTIERATESVLTADGAMWTLLTQLGVSADMIAGHSAGEWAGMVAAGILDLEEYLASLNRLDAMYREVAADRSIPRAAMLAVGADRARVTKLIHDIDCTVHVANDNCPHQVVVVVETDAADGVMKHLLGNGIFVEKLRYDRGYHTPVFTYICEPLRSYFSSLKMRSARTPLYSCTTADLFPGEPGAMLDLAADTFARPIVFREMIERMYADGARVFIEVGPRGNLSGFVDDILRGKPHLTVPTNLPRKTGMAALLQSLGLLSAHHVAIRLEYLFARRDPRRLSWDARADSPVPEEKVPGTIQVPLHYPIMKLLNPQKPLPGAGEWVAHVPPVTSLHDATYLPEADEVEPPAGEGAASQAMAEAAPEAAAWPTVPPAAQPPSIEFDAMSPVAPSVPPPSSWQAQAPGAAAPASARPARAAPGAQQMIQQHFELMNAFLQAQQDVLGAFLGSADVVDPPAFELPASASAYSDPSVELQGAADPPAAAPAVWKPAAADEPSAPASPAPNVTAAPALAPEMFVPPVAAVPASSASSVAVASPVASAASIRDVLIQIVAEKTGYPQEMLDVDLDLEAELGIDSIKRVEILGTLAKAGESSGRAVSVDVEQVSKLKTLRQIVEMLDGAARGVAVAPAAAKPAALPDLPTVQRLAAELPLGGEVVKYTAGEEIVVHRRIHFGEDLYLNDHRFGIVLSADDPSVGGLPVVPLTVSIEIMAEVATLLRPGLLVVGVREVVASKWIDIEKHGASVTLEVLAKARPGENTVQVEVRDRAAYRADKPMMRPSPVCQGTLVLDSVYPPSPRPEPLTLVEEKAPLCTAEEMYGEHRMFHGLMFQGVKSIDRVGRDGLHAHLETLRRDKVLASFPDPQFHIDPFFFDAVGQMVGYWPVEYYTQGFVLFPIRVRELILYRPTPPAGQRFAQQLRLRDVQERTLRADHDIVAADGALWMRVIGWEDWRFYWEPAFYDFWRHPDRHVIGHAVELPRKAGYEDATCYRMQPFGEIESNIWENLYAHLILSRSELSEYHALPRNERRTQWLFGRSAAKDAVRVWIARGGGPKLYPADVVIGVDDLGRPFASGAWTKRVGEVPRVSISHKGLIAVAAASRREIGIDLERVESREASFESVAFDDAERALLRAYEGPERDEWVTRLWCAKEAAAKAIGVGLRDGPGAVVARGFDADSGTVTVLFGGSPTETVEIPVYSRRTGEFVMAVAALEGNGHGGH